MEEKITAVYLLVWNSELLPEDGGDFERPLEKQKQEILAFLRQKDLEALSKVVFYRSRGDLFRDIERDRIARLVVKDIGRLSADPKEMEGVLYELKMRTVELWSVEKGGLVEI
ncbi:MAG: hypothetical protein WAW37_15110 [Syntrophobacteraceae bacterium]